MQISMNYMHTEFSTKFVHKYFSLKFISGSHFEGDLRTQASFRNASSLTKFGSTLTLNQISKQNQSTNKVNKPTKQ